MKMKMKIAIVGAGISGLTSAYFLRNKYCNAKIDIYESRKNEIGGNCFDIINKNYYKQNYGPHIFHTNNKEIWEFLNIFSDFEVYQHKVLSFIKGRYKKIPLHKDELIINALSSTEEIDAETYLYETIGKKNTDLYFKHYSEKQWGISFNELPSSIVNRIPINDVNEDRYFPKDRYQGVPSKGFTNLCRNILSASNATLIYKKVFYQELLKKYDLIILTGKPDEFFNYKFGVLKYRYLNFTFKEYNINSYQQNSVINYPNDYDFIRITEFNKFLPFNKFKKTMIGFEYPSNNVNDIPCYPIFWDTESQSILKKYQEEYSNVIYLGRLANYQYLNIDKAIENTIFIVGKL